MICKEVTVVFSGEFHRFAHGLSDEGQSSPEVVLADESSLLLFLSAGAAGVELLSFDWAPDFFE